MALSLSCQFAISFQLPAKEQAEEIKNFDKETYLNICVHMTN
jgi:hypothetical protein